MIGLTREADDALRIVWLLAKQGARMDTTSIAEQTAVPPKFALKILRKLTLGGVVASQRGKNGGYRLSRAPDSISVRSVIELIDGPVALNRCAESDYRCSRMGYAKSGCAFHCLFAEESKRLADKLEQVTIQAILEWDSCPNEI